MSNYEGLTTIMEELNSFSFDKTEYLFTGIHPNSLSLHKAELKWSTLDYFTPVNVENSFFKDYSDIYIFSSKFALMEKEIFKSLGFDFNRIDAICNVFFKQMSDFKMNNGNLDVISVFREQNDKNYESFEGVVGQFNYYSKIFSGGLDLAYSHIFIQLFLDVKDSLIKPKAKIAFPVSELGYFSVIVGTDELHSIAEQVVHAGVMNEFKALLIDKYPDECFDAIEFNEETLKQYLTIIDMDKI